MMTQASQILDKANLINLLCRLRFNFNLLPEEYRIINNRAIRELEADERGFECNLIGINAIVVANSMALLSTKPVEFLACAVQIPRS